jgi:arabinogalactan endo-1,4-beta-galactosidase
VKRINYEIKLNNVVLLSKHYDDDVTDFEKQEIANKWVRFAFDDLKKQIEEANKK